MKINSKVLSIPPYISTAWDHVVTLQMDEATGNLIVSLKSGLVVTIPKLPPSTLDLIFSSHADSLEGTANVALMPNLSGGIPPGMESGLRLESLGNFTGMMQHDPNQKDAPQLPKEMLSKVSGVAKAMGLDLETFNLPESEPHCNCPFCQITKAMGGNEAVEKSAPQAETEVSDEELTFREWDVVQAGDNLFTVTNPLETTEQYQVFLGTPVGCTCGENNCDHVIAVLNS